MSTPPCIALVGMTSAGKSSLINALFGKPVTEVKRTADTTHLVNRIEFSSDLVIYDTPGVGGEQFENITRLFLGIPQDDELEHADSVPLKSRSVCLCQKRTLTILLVTLFISFLAYVTQRRV